MCGGARLASMPSMPAAPRTDEPTVLVVHANFAVGSAVAQRLMESCLVVLASVASATTRARRHAGCNVVVLCPYLTAAERDGFVRAFAAQEPEPALLELRDEPGAMNARVCAVSVPEPCRRAAEHVFTVLSPHK
jgi:hypothetical protein